jgi:hypothetical protein
VRELPSRPAAQLPSPTADRRPRLQVDDASVKLCPGNRTHYEFVPTGGFCDYSAAHPGVSTEQGHEHTRSSCMLGAGRLGVPKK